MTLGLKIKKIRELRNLTQGHMADLLGISQSAYSKIELDEVNVGHERLEQIAKALGVAIQDILAFDEKVLFNFISAASACGYVNSNVTNYGLSDNERKLFEDKIKLLEEMNDYLKKELERYRSEK